MLIHSTGALSMVVVVAIVLDHRAGERVVVAINFTMVESLAIDQTIVRHIPIAIDGLRVNRAHDRKRRVGMLLDNALGTVDKLGGMLIGGTANKEHQGKQKRNVA